MVPLRITIPSLVFVSLLAGRSEAGGAASAPRCAGEYAEDLSALSAQARKIETETAPYSYAVRTGATYECVSYGSDGTLKKSRTQVRASGTAFGYRRDGGDTLLLTNDHVATWPAVTDADHDVDGVPSGCKRVAETLKIVDDDRDTYEADDLPLTTVAVDPSLDVAILRASTALQVIPWQVGRSAALTERNAVQVKGFPLGAFRATNVGKVVSAHDHDVESGRDHDDFVVDALLTSGGSGSPVLAVSCTTGAFELVGIFHASLYVLIRGSAGGRLPLLLVASILGAWAGDALADRLGLDLLVIGDFHIVGASVAAWVGIGIVSVVAVLGPTGKRL